MINQLVNNMKKVLIILFSVLLLAGCGAKVENKRNQNLQDTIDSNNYILVDVRTKEEYDEGHLKDALNIPYDTIDENVELDKSKTILVYCKSGKRASTAETTLKSLGYTVYNLGGFEQITDFEKVK